MALALNNLKRVDMPLNKETKPNQTNHFVVIYNVLSKLWHKARTMEVPVRIKMSANVAYNHDTNVR